MNKYKEALGKHIVYGEAPKKMFTNDRSLRGKRVVAEQVNF